MKNDPRLVTLIPLEEIEAEAMVQIQKTLARDFVKKLVLLPDIHAGYDLPVGSVALTEGVISPSFVGYDIGCGMCQVKLPDDAYALFSDPGKRDRVRQEIHQHIPVGFASHQNPRRYADFASGQLDQSHHSTSSTKEIQKFCRSVNEKIKLQLGTLGGGNHFIEIGRNEKDEVFITIHSGSRNAGHQVAEHYMKIGKYLALDSPEGKAYLHDMNFLLTYALDNRLEMMKTLLEKVFHYSATQINKEILPTLINENHNHAVVTPNGILHRKGATPADKGQLGVIPGNMRDGVYVTRGLGNEKYLSSASHGAGRVMSRTQAKATLSLDEFRASMEREGVSGDISKQTLDEAPDAYKNLSQVIERQKDIVVEIVDYIRPLVNVKG